MLKSRFLWQVWTVLGITLIFSTVVFGFLVAGQVKRDALLRTEQTLMEQAQALSSTLAPVLDDNRALTITQLNRLVPGTLVRITLIDEGGRVLADNRRLATEMDNHADRPEVLASKLSSHGVAQRYSDTLNQSMFYLSLQVQSEQGKQGYLRLAQPLTALEDQMSALNSRIVLSALTAGLLLLIVGYFLAYRITRPVSEMTATARKVARGEYHLRMPASERPDEFGQLSSVINEMAIGAQQRIDEMTRNRNQLASVLAGLAEGVVALDADQKVLHINDAALSMLGLRGEQVTGDYFSDIRVGNDIRQVVNTAIAETVSLSSTVRLDQQVIECSCVLMKAENAGESGGIILVLEDITERLRLEKVRSDFVANASHELKTPISAVRGLIETIIDDPQMPKDTFQSFVERIRRQTIRLDRIVQELLQLSRFDSSEREKNVSRLELGGLLRQVCQAKLMDAEDAGVDLQLDLQEKLLEIDGEAEAINQLVTNLVDNALKYSREKGLVQLRLSRVGAMARIEVEDNGIGIAQDEIQRIFERFYRVDRARSRDLGGTGLGLAIVKHIAQAHHGRVTVKSQLEQGSVFAVDIPLATG
jgi:two-component system phosphate regulon sensor histidine kinase PhoR